MVNLETDQGIDLQMKKARVKNFSMDYSLMHHNGGRM